MAREESGPDKAAVLSQFKITLLGTKPPIWRRIQTWSCTLDKLHEHIQTAMGWTNSHLHEFTIGDRIYGDPLLMEDDIEPIEYVDSTITMLSDILPKSSKQMRFLYEYDFGDGWAHDVLFEGCPRPELGKRYPLCLEGERSCPPEDVGGVGGHADFLKILADPRDDQHKEKRAWVGRKFDAEKFDPIAATRRMWRRIRKLDWRD